MADEPAPSAAPVPAGHVCGDACPLMSRVVDRLFVGSAAGAFNDGARAANGITHVVGVGVRPPPLPPAPSPKQRPTLYVDGSDEVDTLLLHQFPRTCKYIRDTLSENDTNTVLVHCMYGSSRSVAVVAAFLMRLYRVPVEAALFHCAAVRPCAQVNPGFCMQLAVYQRVVVLREHTPYWAATARWMTAAVHAGAGAGFAQPPATPGAVSPFLLTVTPTPWSPPPTGMPPPPPYDDRFHVDDCCMPRGFLCAVCSHPLAAGVDVPLSHRPSATRVDDTAGAACSHAFLAPLPWMCTGVCDGGCGAASWEHLVPHARGKLKCPGCRQVVGRFDWGGDTCGCGVRVAGPAFALKMDMVKRGTAPE